MGPFKFLSTIFGATANAAVATLGAVEETANTVNVWAELAHKASEESAEQILEELRYENMMRAEELKARLAARANGGAQ